MQFISFSEIVKDKNPVWDEYETGKFIELIKSNFHTLFGNADGSMDKKKKKREVSIGHESYDQIANNNKILHPNYILARGINTVH